jgi:hypothetical protein
MGPQSNVSFKLLSYFETYGIRYKGKVNAIPVTGREGP